MKKVAVLLISSVIFLILTGCSGKSEDDYYNTAKNHIDEGRYLDALAEYENLVKEFPDSKYLLNASFELGKLYHGKVPKNLTAEQSLSKAIEYYTTVYTKFPDSEPAPNSLFMIGFIKANELKDFKGAEEAYNLFLKTYPDNELAASAKAELKNLGIPPEKILEKSAKSAD